MLLNNNNNNNNRHLDIFEVTKSGFHTVGLCNVKTA